MWWGKELVLFLQGSLQPFLQNGQRSALSQTCFYCCVLQPESGAGNRVPAPLLLWDGISGLSFALFGPSWAQRSHNLLALDSVVVGGSCSGHRHSMTAGTWALLHALHVLEKHPPRQRIVTEPPRFPWPFLAVVSKEIMSTVYSAQSSCLQQPVLLSTVPFIGTNEMFLLNNKRIVVFWHYFCHYLEEDYLWQRIK